MTSIKYYSRGSSQGRMARKRNKRYPDGKGISKTVIISTQYDCLHRTFYGI